MRKNGWKSDKIFRKKLFNEINSFNLPPDSSGANFTLVVLSRTESSTKQKNFGAMASATKQIILNQKKSGCRWRKKIGSLIF